MIDGILGAVGAYLQNLILKVLFRRWLLTGSIDLLDRVHARICRRPVQVHPGNVVARGKERGPTVVTVQSKTLVGPRRHCRAIEAVTVGPLWVTPAPR